MASAKAMGNQGRTIQVKKCDLKAACFRQALDQSGGFVDAQMVGEVIPERV
jgi:hypothetical protein